MANIFQYIDYRKFLQDHFLWLKKNRRLLTHRLLCKRAGFNSPNFIKLVMDGKRNLTRQSIPGICEAFELKGREAEFFKSLVFFNQSKKVEDKDHAYEELRNIRRPLCLEHIGHSQMDYLAKWYHVAVRELVEVKNFQEDPLWISQKLRKKISTAQAQKCLLLLETLGFVTRGKEGKIVPRQVPLSTGDEVESLSAFRFHREMIQKALEALKESKAETREISSLTLPVSKQLFETIKKRIQHFRKEILTLVSQEENASAVYQLNFQLFNLTEVLWDDSPKSS